MKCVGRADAPHGTLVFDVELLKVEGAAGH